MKKIIKHITLVLILVAFTLPLATPLFLQIQNLHQQWLMLEELETLQLTTITLKTNEIQWVKKDKECMIHGELFDVKSINVAGDQIILKGLFDEAEKKIKKSIEDNAKNEQQSNKNQQFIKLFSIAATYPETEKLIPYFNVNKQKTLFINIIYTTPFPDYTTPPPKIC